VYNLASGRAETVRRLVEQLRDMIDPRLQLGFGDLPDRPGGPMSLRGNIASFQHATGWSPRTELADGLRITLAWHRSRKNENIRLHCGSAT
jgi:UDP-glucose 4-epimerase